jgi:hypothetical protein
MEEIGQGLDRDEFVDASLRLFSVNFLSFLNHLLFIDSKCPLEKLNYLIQESSQTNSLGKFL